MNEVAMGGQAIANQKSPSSKLQAQSNLPSIIKKEGKESKSGVSRQAQQH